MALKCKAIVTLPYPYQFVRFHQIPLSASMLFIIPVLAIIWIPWDYRSYGFSDGGSIAFMGFRVVGLNASIFADMGSSTRSVVSYGISSKFCRPALPKRMSHSELMDGIRLYTRTAQTPKKLTAAPYVRQDVPTPTVPRRQHNTLLRHAPRLLQTFLVMRKRRGHRAQPDRCAQIGNVAVLTPLGNDSSCSSGLAAL
jgi:hypothetical protein